MMGRQTELRDHIAELESWEQQSLVAVENMRVLAAGFRVEHGDVMARMTELSMVLDAEVRRFAPLEFGRERPTVSGRAAQAEFELLDLRRVAFGRLADGQEQLVRDGEAQLGRIRAELLETHAALEAAELATAVKPERTRWFWFTRLRGLVWRTV